MIKHWDDPLKELVSRAPQDFVKWLEPDYTFDKKLPTHLDNSERGFDIDFDIDTDLLCRVLYEDTPNLFHIQFQRHNDPEAAQQLLLYNVMATGEHDLVTSSILIYPKQEPFVAESPFIQPHHLGAKTYCVFITRQSNYGKFLLRLFYRQASKEFYLSCHSHVKDYSINLLIKPSKN